MTICFGRGCALRVGKLFCAPAELDCRYIHLLLPGLTMDASVDGRLDERSIVYKVHRVCESRSHVGHTCLGLRGISVSAINNLGSTSLTAVEICFEHMLARRAR